MLSRMAGTTTTTTTTTTSRSRHASVASDDACLCTSTPAPTAPTARATSTTEPCTAPRRRLLRLKLKMAAAATRTGAGRRLVRRQVGPEVRAALRAVRGLVQVLRPAGEAAGVERDLLALFAAVGVGEAQLAAGAMGPLRVGLYGVCEQWVALCHMQLRRLHGSLDAALEGFGRSLAELCDEAEAALGPVLDAKQQQVLARTIVTLTDPDALALVLTCPAYVETLKGLQAAAQGVLIRL